MKVWDPATALFAPCPATATDVACAGVACDEIAKILIEEINNAMPLKTS